MNDLISRTKLKNNIAQALSYSPPETLYMSMTVKRILNAIDEEEAVDAVPVVRCKNCRKRMFCVDEYREEDDYFCKYGYKEAEE